MYIFILLLLSIINPQSLQAQLIRSFGFKIGGNIADEDWNYKAGILSDVKNTSRFGLDLGAFVELLDLPVMSIITEIDYTQKGMKYDLPVTGESSPEQIGTQTINNRIDYLSILVLGKARYNLILFSPYIIAGPRVDIEINKNVDKGLNIIFKDFKKNNFGLTFGIGTELIKILPVSLLAEIRYNLDLSDVYSTDNLKIKNKSFDFLVGIMF